MLLAEVEPMSRTHRPSCEFSNREISAMPLERRVSFCGAAGAAVGFEELRNNFIRLSATDAITYRNVERSTSLSTYAPLTPCWALSGRRLCPSGMRLLQWRCA